MQVPARVILHPEQIAARTIVAEWNTEVRRIRLERVGYDRFLLDLDAASMAYGLEARVPFLDHEFVELCSQIPPNLKMRGLHEKHILRRALEGVLPKEILERRKCGLSAPS